MKAVSTLAELVGVVLIAVGLGMFMPWVGVVAGGVGLVVVGVLLDPPDTSRPPQ